MRLCNSLSSEDESRHSSCTVALGTNRLLVVVTLFYVEPFPHRAYASPTSLIYTGRG